MEHYSSMLFIYIWLMKLLSLILGFILATQISYAQNSPANAKDTSTVAPPETAILIEQVPAFPGGTNAFMTYVGRHINKPELVTLFGFKGRIVV